jgi:hypothetical protein
VKFAIFALSLAMSSPLAAEGFTVTLAGKVLGEVRYTVQSGTATLRSTLDSTPLGVFNGTFMGTSTGLITGQFSSESRSSRKQRAVSVQIEDSRATGVKITPENEITDLSDVSRVPSGVMDPVRVFGTMLQANGCPPAMQMYDGRRVSVFQPGGASRSGDILTCEMRYGVARGPGHLSPLGVSSAAINLSYSTTGSSQILQALQISSGLFSIVLTRNE